MEHVLISIGATIGKMEFGRQRVLHSGRRCGCLTVDTNICDTKFIYHFIF